MSNGLASRRPRPLRRAFTLAELLIVIAIIGVLISILLPTLGAARRSANSVKCLSSLRQIGQAFQMYAQDNKRSFPVSEFTGTPGTNPLASTDPPTRTWIDFISKYLHRREATDPTNPSVVNYEQFRQGGSPVWGCPSYNTDAYYDPTVATTSTTAFPSKCKFNTGYGMSRYGLAPYSGSFADQGAAAAVSAPAQVNGTAASPGNTALIRPSGTPAVFGSFLKMEQWGRHGAAKGLIADANYYDILSSSIWNKSNAAQTEPWIDAKNPTANTYIFVDAARHLKTNVTQREAAGSKGINVLFVDGHASSLDASEAWIAIRGGGIDCRQGQ